MYIGNTILELRKQKHMTQEELAAQLGVTAAAVSKWENNYTLPDILMLCALADLFDVTTDTLLGRTAAVKEAVVVTESGELAESIGRVLESHGFRVAARFSAFPPALSYTLAHESCRYIFTGGSRDLITVADIEATPAEINSIHIIGETDEDILRGFEGLSNNLHLFTK